jgi:ribosomal-protein-alanine N-acetyltransferase
VELRGPTLTLRYPERSDAERLFELGRDDGVTGWFSWGPYRDLGQVRAWLADVGDERAEGRDLAFVIEHPEDGVVGVTSLNELSRRDRRAMVGTWIGRDSWGTGVNAESKALIAHLAFATCGLRRLGAYSNTDNERSTRALQRLGFKREGTLARWHRHGDREFDVYVFALLAEDWRPAFDVIADGEPPAVWLAAAS